MCMGEKGRLMIFSVHSPLSFEWQYTNKQCHRILESHTASVGTLYIGTMWSPSWVCIRLCIVKCTQHPGHASLTKETVQIISLNETMSLITVRWEWEREGTYWWSGWWRKGFTHILMSPAVVVIDGLPLSKTGWATADNTKYGHECMFELVDLGKGEGGRQREERKWGKEERMVSVTCKLHSVFFCCGNCSKLLVSILRVA